eukprot:154338-Ditylum_brightwellii.AAC.1
MAWKSQDVFWAEQKLKFHYKRNSKLITLSSNDPTATDYQPGGMITVIGNSHMDRVLEAHKDNDELERWSWMVLAGEKNKLYIVTAYRVQQTHME